MANATTATVYGNLTRDPELRELPSGDVVTELGVAENTRRFIDGEWVDGEPEFFDVQVYDKSYAHNIVDSLTKGDRVVVQGRLRFRSWEADDGTRRSKVNLVVDSRFGAVGLDLRWTKVNDHEKVVHKNGSGGQEDEPI